MEKIWDRKSEVIGRCGRDKKKGMTLPNRQKLNAKKRFIEMVSFTRV